MINTKLVSFRSFEHYKCFSVCWKQTCNTLYHISVHCSDFPLHSCRKGDKNVQMKVNSIVFCVSVLSMWQMYSMRLCFIYSKCSSSSSLLVAHFCALSSVLVPGYISSKRFSSLLFTFLSSSFFPSLALPRSCGEILAVLSGRRHEFSPILPLSVRSFVLPQLS